MFILLLSISTLGYALPVNTISKSGWDSLTETQQAALIAQIADNVSQNNTKAQQVVPTLPETVDPKQVDDWVTLGEHVGKAFGGAAKELNIAVNDFIKTPVGMLAMILIVWNVIGTTILHVFGSIIIIIVGFGFLTWHRRVVYGTKCEYDSEKKDIFGRSRLISTESSDLEDGWKFAYWVTMVVIVVGSLIVLLAR